MCLAAYWNSLRAGPIALKPIAVKALAADRYRSLVKRFESDYAVSDEMQTITKEYNEATQWHLDDGVADPQLSRTDGGDRDAPPRGARRPTG